MTPHDEAVEAALDAFYGKGMWPPEATREELIHDMRLAIAAYEAAMLKCGWQWTKIVRRERPPLDLSDMEEAP
jgi:hypothetical protein